MEPRLKSYSFPRGLETKHHSSPVQEEHDDDDNVMDLTGN